MTASIHTDLVILICSDGSELSSRKKEGLEVIPVQVVYIFGLHHVQARMVLVHAVYYNLQGTDERLYCWYIILCISGEALAS